MEPFQALCEFLGIVPICSFLVVLFSALGNVLPCEHRSVLESQAPVGGQGVVVLQTFPVQHSSSVLPSPASLAALARPSLDSQHSPQLHETLGTVWVPSSL